MVAGEVGHSCSSRGADAEKTSVPVGCSGGGLRGGTSTLERPTLRPPASALLLAWTGQNHKRTWKSASWVLSYSCGRNILIFFA